MKLKLQLFLLIISYSLCCENMCGSHGICGQNDKCECFIGWGGSDCSQRICPYGEAFIDIPLGDLDHDGKITTNAVKTEWRPNVGIAENLQHYVTSSRAHRYAECSNAGLCDKKTGTCTCFEGFEGSSCQRRSCPSAIQGRTCSGHGSCLSGSAILAETESNNYFSWDTMKYRTCVCDKGWEGIDCNLRQCNMGVDLSANSIEFKYTFKLTTTNFNNKEIDYYFQYIYDGIVYESTNVKGRDLSNYCPTDNNILDNAIASEYAEEIRRSIRLINPLSQSTVSVKCSGEHLLEITVDAKYVDADEYCSDKSGFKIITDDTTKEVKADKSNKDICDNNKSKLPQSLCSGRGLCNTEMGLCECFAGYYGAACENQLSIAI